MRWNLYLSPEGGEPARTAIPEPAPRDAKPALGEVVREGNWLLSRFRQVPAVAKVLNKPDLDQAGARHLADGQPVCPVEHPRGTERGGKAGRGCPEGPGRLCAQVVLVPVRHGQS
jgi:hypothetical protein